jgi:hypothetical protein
MYVRLHETGEDGTVRCIENPSRGSRVTSHGDDAIPGNAHVRASNRAGSIHGNDRATADQEVQDLAPRAEQ